VLNLGIGYDLFEVTSSGLTHFYKLAYVIDYLLANDYKYSETYSTFNFGVINFIWGSNKEDSKIRFSIRDIENKEIINLTLNAKDLTYAADQITDPNCSNLINRRFKSLTGYITYYFNHMSELPVLLLYVLILIALCIIILVPLYILIKIISYCRRGKQEHQKMD
jgi:hypothetical protein